MAAPSSGAVREGSGSTLDRENPAADEDRHALPRNQAAAGMNSRMGRAGGAMLDARGGPAMRLRYRRASWKDHDECRQAAARIRLVRFGPHNLHCPSTMTKPHHLVADGRWCLARWVQPSASDVCRVWRCYSCRRCIRVNEPGRRAVWTGSCQRRAPGEARKRGSNERR